MVLVDSHVEEKASHLGDVKFSVISEGKEHANNGASTIQLENGSGEIDHSYSNGHKKDIDDVQFEDLLKIVGEAGRWQFQVKKKILQNFL